MLERKWVLKHPHYLTKCDDSSTFKKIDVDVHKRSVSSGYGFLNIKTDSQHNYLESLISYNDMIDTYMNETLHNGDMSTRIGLLNIHTLPQASKSSQLNEMNMSVDNDDVNGDYFYMYR